MAEQGFRIVCLVQWLELPSVRLRIGAFLPYLREAGVEASLVKIPKGLIARLKLFSELKSFDGVLVAKKLFPDWQVGILRRNARRLIYDFDDAVMFRDREVGNFVSRTRRRRFRRIARAADLVIAGNNYLKEQASPFARNVAVVPTCIDPSAYILKEHKGAADKVTVGWIGSHSTVKYLDFLKPVLSGLTSSVKAIEVKVVADAFPEALDVPIVKKPWKAEEEAADLASFDVGIMPLPDNPWTRGKCGMKLLQYQAAGLPAVASPVGVNREIIEDGVTGFLAESRGEWLGKLKQLVEDDQLRARMGRQARENVETHFALSRWGPKLASLIKQTLQD